MKKKLELVVLEDGKLTDRKIAEITVEPTVPIKYYVSLAKWDGKEMGIDSRYSPHMLTYNYVTAIGKVHQAFMEVVGNGWEESSMLYQALLKARFQYASAEAYARIMPPIPKEKEDDEEIIAAAHYNCSHIWVSLPDQFSLKKVRINGIHEFGHHMHQYLEPGDFTTADPTMKEFMASLVEEAAGVREYGLDDQKIHKPNTMHGRAEELLIKAKQTKFKGKTFAEKWNILKSFYQHEDLSDYLDEKLLLFRSCL